uniref:Uncharacterized protein n=1 Tax=Anguilla anguilla TaxID=7936 RepID=A0A0E9PB82_ANGAN
MLNLCSASESLYYLSLLSQFFIYISLLSFSACH